MDTLQNIVSLRKTNSHEQFRSLLPPMLDVIESEWRRVARTKSRGHAGDTPRQSLLRVAHHTLASLLELAHEDEVTR